MRLVLTGAAINACLFAYVQGGGVTQPCGVGKLPLLDHGFSGGDISISHAGRAPLFCHRFGDHLRHRPFAERDGIWRKRCYHHGGQYRSDPYVGISRRNIAGRYRDGSSGSGRFIGLAAPHLGRAMIGSDFRWLLPYCLLLGPILLLSADVVARIIIAPGEVMVGVITAAVGGPLLYAVVNSKKGIVYASR